MGADPFGSGAASCRAGDALTGALAGTVSPGIAAGAVCAGFFGIGFLALSGSFASRSNTMVIRRLRGEVGSSGTRSSAAALPTTRVMRPAPRPYSSSARRLASARSVDSSQLD